MKTLKELADIVGGKILGDELIEIHAVSSLEDAKNGDISFLSNSKYKKLLSTTKASAVIVDEKDVSFVKTAAIICSNPSLAFDQLIQKFSPPKLEYPIGIHPTAVIDPSAKVGKNVSIGPHVVIEANAQISNGCCILANTYVGHSSKVGEGCLIYPNVTIREYVQIGKQVIIHSGSVIGSDGYGYVQVHNKHQKIVQYGGVIVEDDVEIGANVTIDRARFQNTIIGQGTKIDNLVQIAHNVITGKNCLIIAQVGISGSTTLGDQVVLAGQVGVVGHIRIGDKVLVGAQSGISKDVPEGQMMFGTPAQNYSDETKQIARLKKLAYYYQKTKELENRLQALEDKLPSHG